MAVAWRWIPDGDGGWKGATFGDEGLFYALPEGGVSQSERTEISNRLEMHSAIWGILYSARAAFVTGSADYRDACESLNNLITELFKAKTQLDSTLQDVGSYLAPQVVMPIDTMQERIAFAKELVSKLTIKGVKPIQLEK